MTPTPSKSARPSAAVQLEQAAMKLTLYARALRAQLLRLRLQLADAKQAVLTAEEDVRESAARLQEIEELQAKLRLDVTALLVLPTSRDDGSLAARRQELGELEEERQEELALLGHIHALRRFHQNAEAKARQLLGAMTKELARVRRREEVVVLVALRSRIVKVLAPKI